MYSYLCAYALYSKLVSCFEMEGLQLFEEGVVQEAYCIQDQSVEFQWDNYSLKLAT